MRYLVNTHWHFDHTDGNAWLHAAGATIVAQENTRRRMATATRVEGWDFTFPPSPPAALPGVASRGPMAVYLNGVAAAVDRVASRYARTLRVVLGFRAWVVGGAAVLVAASVWVSGRLPSTFFPDIDESMERA